jgi:DNA-directed RNA polymerase specialized sigma24 family protein
MPGEVADPTAIEDRILEADRRASLVAAYERLPARHRRLLTLLLTDPPASYAVISEALGMPIGSIGPTRARALARLRLECNPVPAFDEGRPKGDD